MGGGPSPSGAGRRVIRQTSGLVRTGRRWLAGRPGTVDVGAAVGLAVGRSVVSVALSLSFVFWRPPVLLQLLMLVPGQLRCCRPGHATKCGAGRICEADLNHRCKKNTFYVFNCALAATQCIVIGPPPLSLSVGSVNTITRNCVHRSSPNWVCS